MRYFNPQARPAADDWRELLRIDELGVTPPGAIYDGRGDDGAPLLLAVWGDGGWVPYVLSVYVFARTAEVAGVGWKGDPRYPTYPELQDAVDVGTLPGALFTGVAIMAGAELQDFEDYRWLQVRQVGAADGSEAGRRLQLSGNALHMGGLVQ